MYLTLDQRVFVKEKQNILKLFVDMSTATAENNLEAHANWEKHAQKLRQQTPWKQRTKHSG